MLFDKKINCFCSDLPRNISCCKMVQIYLLIQQYNSFFHKLEYQSLTNNKPINPHHKEKK